MPGSSSPFINIDSHRLPSAFPSTPINQSMTYTPLNPQLIGQPPPTDRLASSSACARASRSSDTSASETGPGAGKHSGAMRVVPFSVPDHSNECFFLFTKKRTAYGVLRKKGRATGQWSGFMGSYEKNMAWLTTASHLECFLCMCFTQMSLI